MVREEGRIELVRQEAERIGQEADPEWREQRDREIWEHHMDSVREEKSECIEGGAWSCTERGFSACWYCIRRMTERDESLKKEKEVECGGEVELPCFL